MSIDLILGQLALFQERLSQASPLAEEEMQNLIEIFQRINTCSLRQEDKAAISNLQGRVAQTPQIKELQRIFLFLLGRSSDDMTAYFLGLKFWEVKEVGTLKEGMIYCLQSQGKELYLRGSKLSILPPGIGRLTHIQELYLSHNQLRSLPPEIGQLKELVRLVCNNNQIESLPTQIGKFPKLTHLNFNNNQLTSLPLEIGNLTQLKKLQCSENELTALPLTLASLTGTKLNFEHNEISTLAPELNHLTINLSHQRAPKQRNIQQQIPSLPVNTELEQLNAQISARILNSRKAFDKAFEEMPDSNLDLLVTDRDKWETTEPLPKANLKIFDEPGYFPALFDTMKYVIRDSLGVRLDAVGLRELHDHCVHKVFHDADMKKPFKKGYAPRFGFNFKWNPNSDEVRQELYLEKVLDIKNRPPMLSSANTDWNFEYLSFEVSKDTYSSIESCFRSKKEIHAVHKKINALFDKYYTNIESSSSEEDKLTAIAGLCRALHIFHVFPDGNGRTILFVLLQKLLIENGFSPVIVDAPSVVFTGKSTTKEMIAILRKGMENYKRVVEQLNTPVRDLV